VGDDPKPTVAPGASTVRLFSRQLLNRNALGANHAPANKMEKAVRIRGAACSFSNPWELASIGLHAI